MTDFIATLDGIISEKSLLKHPFYQAWTAGTLPMEKLREYAKQYFHFEAAFPTFLSAIHAHCELDGLNFQRSFSQPWPQARVWS